MFSQIRSFAIGRQRLIALGVVVALGAAPCSSLATPDYLDKFLKAYKLSESSKVGAKSCAVCHVSDEDFSMNSYGKQLLEQLKTSKAAEMGESTLHAIDAMDADGDGVSNGDEIAADSLPGDPASKPGDVAPVERAAQEEAKRFIPKNWLHPAAVHFPIGLFLVGLFLDFLGMIGKRREMLFAGWYNLVIAAISGLVGIATGFGAALNMNFPLKGLVLQHLLLAVASIFAMWMMVALRVHRHKQMNYAARIAYYALAIIAIATLSYGGHLGGVMVYGE